MSVVLDDPWVVLRDGGGRAVHNCFPTRDLVLVHKVNIDQDDQRHIDEGAWMTMLEKVIDPKCDSGCK